MAKSKDSPEGDDDDKFEKMDTESLDFLEQVRKGKSRNFVLSVKGNKVRSLLVKKKKIKAVDVKEARGQGYQPVFGIVSGQGANITFEIARSDGFEEAPGGGKTEKLKKFLKVQTGKAFKPEYKLVDTKSVVPFDEDDLQNPLIARFMKLETAIVKVLDKFPDQTDTLGRMTSDTRDTLQEEAWIAAKDKIAALESYLKTTLSGGAAPTGQAAPPPPPPPPPPSQKAGDPAALAAKLAEALKKLKPLMDKVINVHPDRKGELHATMAQIAGEIKAKQFDQAKQNVTDFATLLKSLTAQQPAPSAAESVDRMQEFAGRRDALEPRLLDAQKADPEKAAKLGAVWDYANEQSQAGNHENAVKALNRLETAIDGILAAPSRSDAERLGIPENIVEERKKFLSSRWQQTVSEVGIEIEKLTPAIASLLPESTAKQLVDGVQAGLSDFYDKMNEAILSTGRATAADPSSLEAALQVVRNYIQQIPNEPRIQCFKAAKDAVGVEVNLEGVLMDALTALESRLAS